MRVYALARWYWALTVLAFADQLGTSCPPCPPPPALCEFQGEPTQGECVYTINNKNGFELATTESYFSLRCPDNVTLDDPSLPVLEYSATVVKAYTTNCGVPITSYTQALGRLNVSVVDYLSLTRLPQAKLHAGHFEGLQSIKTLLVHAQDTEKPLQADGAMLKPLISLKKLYISGVLLPNSTLEEPPQYLEELSLRQCGIGVLPETTLKALPNLRFFIFVDKDLEEPPNTAVVPNLRRLTISSPRLKRAPSPANIHFLTIESVQDLHLEGKCEALGELTIRSAFITALPERWVSNCHQLTKMTLLLNNLTHIPENALENASNIKTFKLTGSNYLTTLPARLFRDTRELVELDLSRNNITSLPRGIFSLLSKLEVLKLSNNNIIGGTYPMETLRPLSALTTLRVLYLDGNPLGDLCAITKESINQQQMSPLSELPALQTLSLAGTGLVHICLDWRQKLSQLKDLDLSHNNIEELKAIDLQWTRSEDKVVNVNLINNPIRSVVVTRSEAAVLQRKRVTVIFNTNATMRCDCNMFWFAKAIQAQMLGVEFHSIHCDAPHPMDEIKLRNFPPSKMICHIHQGCPNNCDCIVSPEDETMLVDCQNRSLKDIPDLSGLPSKMRTELNVSNNLIASLPSIIPPKVVVLDITDNKLSEFSPATIGSLISGIRRIWMKGNPLSCRCSDLLPRRLHAPVAAARVMDFETAQCSDGRTLQQATRDGCMVLRAAIWGVGGAAIALIFTAAVLIALKKAVRLRLKAYLLARGLCVRWVKPDDADDCIYDAFVSFSHQDREYVEVLMAELETGPRPLKLCIHDRDWPVGGWIPAQIASSVAESRRTVILLSKNFLESFWARVEFREAYARAILETKIRLIVVILDEKPPEGLDSELQHYISNNTYVKWGEPAFWEKLRTALPEPRPVPKKPKKKTAKQKPIPMPAPSSGQHFPNILVVPNPNPVESINTPQTPIVKFAHMELPAPQKPAKIEACPCA